MSPKILEKPIPVKYSRGYFKILIDLPLKDEEELKVQIVPKKEKTIKSTSNAKAVLKALKAAQGTFPKNQSGLAYTRKIRKSWDDRLDRLYGR